MPYGFIRTAAPYFIVGSKMLMTLFLEVRAHGIKSSNGDVYLNFGIDTEHTACILSPVKITHY